MIGWYHTGPKLRASDLEINQVIKRYTSKPVMVIVDIRPDAERGSGKGAIPTDAYFAVEEIKDVSTGVSSVSLSVHLIHTPVIITHRMERRRKIRSSTSRP